MNKRNAGFLHISFIFRNVIFDPWSNSILQYAMLRAAFRKRLCCLSIFYRPGHFVAYFAYFCPAIIQHAPYFAHERSVNEEADCHVQFATKERTTSTNAASTSRQIKLKQIKKDCVSQRQTLWLWLLNTAAASTMISRSGANGGGGGTCVFNDTRFWYFYFRTLARLYPICVSIFIQSEKKF